MTENPVRNSIITEKNPREILMLRGSGCKWRRCTFCDYHLDFSKDERANFETHWMHRDEIFSLREMFRNIDVDVKMKIGVETFDEAFREKVFHKGMANASPEDIAKYCDEVCLLFGFTGQNAASMKNDIETGLQYFERVCVNIMVENTTKLKPDSAVIRSFLDEIYLVCRENPRVDILLNNTDFGVGGENNVK